MPIVCPFEILESNFKSACQKYQKKITWATPTLKATENILRFSLFYCDCSPSLSPFPKSLQQMSGWNFPLSHNLFLSCHSYTALEATCAQWIRRIFNYLRHSAWSVLLESLQVTPSSFCSSVHTIDRLNFMLHWSMTSNFFLWNIFY